MDERTTRIWFQWFWQPASKTLNDEKFSFDVFFNTNNTDILNNCLLGWIERCHLGRFLSVIMYRTGRERDTTPYTASFQLNHPRFDASAQHRALARRAFAPILNLQHFNIKLKFARHTVCGEEDSCFGSYKRPIRMSTTVYINSYRGHSFLIHLDFLEFKDFALSVWVFRLRISIIKLHWILIW